MKAGGTEHRRGSENHRGEKKKTIETFSIHLIRICPPYYKNQLEKTNRIILDQLLNNSLKNSINRKFSSILKIVPNSVGFMPGIPDFNYVRSINNKALH